jgi:NAD(P)-dependent dehydrogenase (short-subunit alcohol dehydrogenase family)
VTINGRTAARVGAAVQALEREIVGAQVAGVAADLGRAEGCAALARQVPEVDILVNNVGIFEPKPFEDIPDEDWLRFFETNVMS